MQLYNFTINPFDLSAYEGSDERDEALVEYCNGVVWGEIEVEESAKPAHSTHILTVGDVGVWYNYGADYFFFEALV